MHQKPSTWSKHRNKKQTIHTHKQNKILHVLHIQNKDKENKISHNNGYTPSLISGMYSDQCYQLVSSFHHSIFKNFASDLQDIYVKGGNTDNLTNTRFCLWIVHLNLYSVWHFIAETSVKKYKQWKHTYYKI